MHTTLRVYIPHYSERGILFAEGHLGCRVILLPVALTFLARKPDTLLSYHYCASLETQNKVLKIVFPLCIINLDFLLLCLVYTVICTVLSFSIAAQCITRNTQALWLHICNIPRSWYVIDVSLITCNCLTSKNLFCIAHLCQKRGWMADICMKYLEWS